MSLAHSVAKQQHPVAALYCLPPARVPVVWPHIEKYFEAAFDRGIGDDDLESVRADVHSGKQLVWIVLDGEDILAAVATKLIRTAKKKLCVLTAGGGGHMTRWAALKAVLEDYATREGCDAMRVMGRRGWQHVLNDYHQPWICLEKQLKD